MVQLMSFILYKRDIEIYKNQNKFIYRSVSRFKTLHNIYVRTAGWGRRFSFGYHDREKKVEGTYDNPTKYSACMTTHESPESSQFQMCDTLEVVCYLVKK